MGRAFEFRKVRKLKRWGNMARQFTRIGREIVLAVKSGGGDPDSNSRLRAVIQNGKAVNMPKDRIDAAIKRALGKEQENYEEVLYEGMGPHGIGVMVETATDNPTRTVANLRLYFNRSGGNLGTSGSVGFMFERKGIFRFAAEGVNLEELELELIDFGAEDIFEQDGEIWVYTQFEDFGSMQKGLEEKGVNIIEAKLERIPMNTIELNPEQQAEVEALLEKLDDDDDVQNVFHNMG